METEVRAMTYGMNCRVDPASLPNSVGLQPKRAPKRPLLMLNFRRHVTKNDSPQCKFRVSSAQECSRKCSGVCSCTKGPLSSCTAPYWIRVQETKRSRMFDPMRSPPYKKSEKTHGPHSLQVLPRWFESEPGRGRPLARTCKPHGTSPVGRDRSTPLARAPSDGATRVCGHGHHPNSEPMRVPADHSHMSPVREATVSIKAGLPVLIYRGFNQFASQLLDLTQGDAHRSDFNPEHDDLHRDQGQPDADADANMSRMIHGIKPILDETAECNIVITVHACEGATNKHSKKGQERR